MNRKDPTPGITKFHALILAAGKGSRFASDTPKQFQTIAGKTVLEQSIDKFIDLKQCLSITVTMNPDDAIWVQPIQKRYPKVKFTNGGNQRNLSVYNCLKSIHEMKSNDIILIHDAARPCVSHEDILRLLIAMNDSQAATLAHPVTDTLRRSDLSKHSQENVNRDNLWSIQTPQAFRYEDILIAHQNNTKEDAPTDDSALVSAMGIKVKLVHGARSNIKITHPEDITMAETILNAQTETRSGLGFDVHAFDFEKKGPVRLCGIDIAHDHPLQGHSDADVALHTITDALLGAIGEGDIGRHFPPSDNSFKNMDSAIFLEKAMEMVQAKGGAVINIDLTIICEAPKINTHADSMRARLSEITGLEQSRINIKATTTEQLGFTGRREGIAAQALASVRMPCHNKTA